MTAPGAFRLYSLRDDVTVDAEPGGGAVTLSGRWGDAVLPRPAGVVVEAMRRMSLGPTSLANVLSTPDDWGALWTALAPVGHLVVWSLGSSPERAGLSVVPVAPEARFGLPWPGSPPPEATADPPAALASRLASGAAAAAAAGARVLVRLSRFARIATTGHLATVESPLSLFRVLLHEPAALARLSSLMTPVDPDTLPVTDRVAVGYLLAAGIAVAAPDGPGRVAFDEDADPALTGWTPGDLAFHTQSTLGRHDQDFGATFPRGEDAGVEPVVAARAGARVLPLPRPAWADVVRSPPFAVVSEAQAPVRAFTDAPVGLALLGSLLYLTARVRALVGSCDPAAAHAGSDRPYLSCTDAYELEVYVAVRGGGEPGAGVYHYDPLGHRLVALEVDRGGVDELHEMASTQVGPAATPAVLLLVTARFRRLSWAYAGLPYALVLKDVGALTQSLALAATTLGLASFPLWTVDVETSSRVLRTDWRVECAVGGFLVGRPAAPGGEGAGRVECPVNDADWATGAQRVLRESPAGRVTGEGMEADDLSHTLASGPYIRFEHNAHCLSRSVEHDKD